MIDTQTLRAVAVHPGTSKETLIMFLLKAADEIDRLKRGGWISVKERLPDEESHFIVADQYGNVFYSEYDEGGFWLDWDQEPDSVVTHWQPLPEPPKEE